ncbi:MAG: transposase [Candidatus Paceibacterota bacterium]
MSYHHIYNRGAHRSLVFLDNTDYLRMIKLLYLANQPQPFHLREIGEKNVFQVLRTETHVNIVAYCLMPNHIHIAVNAKTDLELDPGITKFMHKLCTGYSMYFNKKYNHSGTVWEGPYKEKIGNDDDEYMRTLISYIHLNPYGIKEPSMTREARKEHPKEAFIYSINYEYSSLQDYLGPEASPRVQQPILCQKELRKWRWM